MDQLSTSDKTQSASVDVLSPNTVKIFFMAGG